MRGFSVAELAVVVVACGVRRASTTASTLAPRRTASATTRGGVRCELPVESVLLRVEPRPLAHPRLLGSELVRLPLTVAWTVVAPRLGQPAPQNFGQQASRGADLLDGHGLDGRQLVEAAGNERLLDPCNGDGMAMGGIGGALWPCQTFDRVIALTSTMVGWPLPPGINA